ncbi:lytic murein transglycosylase [Stutzerimonas xanthomarina]|uniref:Lytic murein transglycosylase n=1 Tax=Stutzerimonas xanthomarina TaxID=271420 RepID=A0A3R8U0B8_9GAMM|nr:lytic murein transglycosylase [Stutzerimonas xanthomarina]RRV07849.1 lytic murein transglycosylase [Stutzerimonas xanthomarina]RRV71721.1 lytic murein transglycosylase [Stutzerimonas stutzeri]
MPIPRSVQFVLLSLALAASGCSEEEGSASIPKAANAAPTLEQLPKCERIAARLTPLLDGLTLVDQDDGGRYDNVTVYGISCSWLSREMQNADISQQVKGGGLSIGISVDETPSDEQMLRKMGMVHDDARAEDIGGFVVDVSERMDPSAQLGIIGPQVVVGRVTVTATAAGIALQKVESMEYITNDQAIEAAIAIHRMLR